MANFKSVLKWYTIEQLEHDNDRMIDKCLSIIPTEQRVFARMSYISERIEKLNAMSEKQYAKFLSDKEKANPLSCTRW